MILTVNRGLVDVAAASASYYEVTMRDIRIATAQFEHRDNDKPYNLSRVAELARRAVDAGAEIVSFHECCIPGYSWIQPSGQVAAVGGGRAGSGRAFRAPVDADRRRS